VQARLQLLAPKPVRAAAEAYADAITEANPLLKLPDSKREYHGLASHEKGRLKNEFVEAARKDLDAR
jgi:hypothetical protein